MDPPLDKCSLDFFLVSKFVNNACLSPVKSIGNRVVVFDGSLQHRSKSQTDTKRRMVLNINWKV